MNTMEANKTYRLKRVTTYNSFKLQRDNIPQLEEWVSSFGDNFNENFSFVDNGNEAYLIVWTGPCKRKAKPGELIMREDSGEYYCIQPEKLNELYEELPSSPAVPQGAEEYWDKVSNPSNFPPPYGKNWMDEKKFLAYAQQQLPQSSEKQEAEKPVDVNIVLEMVDSMFGTSAKLNYHLGDIILAKMNRLPVDKMRRTVWVHKDTAPSSNSIQSFPAAVQGGNNGEINELK